MICVCHLLCYTSLKQIWETAKLCDLKEFTVNVAACTGQCITQRIARKVREFIITVKDHLVGEQAD